MERKLNMISLGLMSGTSCDGVDGAIIETDGHKVQKFIAEYYLPYDPEFSKQLLAVMQGQVSYLDVENELTEYHIRVVKELEKISGVTPEVIGFHGQTIFHAPSRGITSQIGNPHLLAAKTQINVVADFRRKDVAYGGQGAPLVPIFHKAIMNGGYKTVAVINIGGVSNITYIDGQDVLLGYDLGPGNAYINDAMRKYYNKSYDNGGKIAASGKVHEEIVQKFMQDPFFTLPIPKSLDRNHFAWLASELKSSAPEDIVATLTMITVKAISYALFNSGDHLPEMVFICGGGAHNKTMMDWLSKEVENIPVRNISDLGLKSDFIEAQAFAFLAARCIKNLPSTFPSTTGVSQATVCGLCFPF